MQIYKCFYLANFNKFVNLKIVNYVKLAIFMGKTGLLCCLMCIIFPLLPPDSLLFSVGVLSAQGLLDPLLSILLLSIAAILGDTVNYWLGGMGAKMVFGKYVRREYLRKATRFYERHGAITIVVARFMPILRAFAPFVAGVARMNYRRFLFYNVVGGIGWVCLFVLGGYFFGNIPLVKNNFSVVIVLILATSLIPWILTVVHHKRHKA